MEKFISYILSTFTITGMQLLIIFGPILLIAAAMHFFSGVIERKLCKLLAKLKCKKDDHK